MMTISFRKSLKGFISSFLEWNGWSVPIFSILLAATITVPLWKNLRVQYVYHEFVVGLTSWGNKGKEADFLAFYILIGLTLCIYAFFQLVISRDADSGNHLAETVRSLIWLTFLPLAFWFGSLLVDPRRVGLPVVWAISAIVLVVFLISVACRREPRIDSEKLFRVCSLFFVAALLCLFVGLTFVQITSLVMGNFWSAKSVDLCLVVTIVLGMIPLFLLWFKFGLSVSLERFSVRYLLFLQIPLPLLFFTVLPPRLVYLSKLQDYQWPVLLILCLFVCILIAWRELFLRGCKLWNSSSLSSHPFANKFSPLCLMGIAIFIAVRSSGVPTFFADDFHLGEQLIPWQQLVEFGKIPYIDFAPVHGLMPLIIGCFNWLFYDGTMANLINSTNLLQAVGCGITFLTIYYLAGVPSALFCSFLFSSQFFGSAFDRLLFLAPAVFILAYPELYKNRNKWLLVWLGIASFMALYNPSAGGAFCVGTAPFALWQAVYLYRENRPVFLRIGFCSALLLIAVLALPMSREILLGYLTFIAENGATNTVAHGIPLSMSIGSTPFDSGLLSNFVIFEFFRLAWIPVLLLGGFLALRLLANDQEGSKGSKLFLLLSSILIFVILSIWSLGRIDSGAASRTGAVSFVLFGLFLPVFLVATQKKNLPLVFVFLAVFGGIFGALFNFQDHFNARQLGQRAIRSNTIPGGMLKVSGAEVGMTNLGLIYADPARLHEVKDFRNSLSQVISEDQTYFDLTNKQAHYFFGNKAVPALYSATFNVVNRKQQGRILGQLRAAPPAAVVIQPSMNFDGFSSSLRSFYLYRNFVLNYNPVQVGKSTFMVNKSSSAFQGAATGTDKKRILSEVFAHYDLRAIPANWGRSWDEVLSEINKVAEIDLDSFVELNNVESLGTGIFKITEPLFDEVFYLRSYPDVTSAVVAGNLKSGFQHYQMYGKGEGRLPNENFQAPFVNYDLSKLNISGREVDFVVLEISSVTDSKPIKELVLRWSADGEWAANAVRFEIQGNRLVVPLSSFPDWLLATRLEILQVSAPKELKSFEIKQISLWRRNDI